MVKGLGKILFGYALLTSFLLLYVHERVEMLRVSYRIYAKASRLSEQTEEFRRLKFEVSHLRSPQHLEKRLSELSIPLTLPKQIQVLRVPAPPRPELSLEPLRMESPSGRLFDFLGRWVQVAQARPEQS